MTTTQEWLRVNLNLPPSERGGGSDAFPEQSGTIPKAILGQQQSSLRQLPRRRRRRRAPGTIAGSRSSDEILQRNTNVALSPVTGPGATSFSSVASAFDFHHHLGSDPASELLVLKHILTRECLLSRLETVCGQLRKRFQLCPATATSDSSTARLGEVGNDIVNLLSSMRNATVAVIEAISVWRKDMTERPPSAFVWDGDNYLLKITNDLNFLAGVQPLVDTLKVRFFTSSCGIRQNTASCLDNDCPDCLRAHAKEPYFRPTEQSNQAFAHVPTVVAHVPPPCLIHLPVSFVADAPGTVLSESFDASANTGRATARRGAMPGWR